jgi:hypothetical protein
MFDWLFSRFSAPRYFLHLWELSVIIRFFCPVVWILNQIESVSRLDPDATRCVDLDPVQQKITPPPPPEKNTKIKWLEDLDVLPGGAVASPEVWSSQTVSLQSLPLQSIPF